MSCLNVGTRVQFDDVTERGVADGQVEEIIYMVKRDSPIPVRYYAGDHSTPEHLYAVCTQGSTLAANKEGIRPLQITQIMEGGRSRNSKTRKTARRNNRHYSRRN